MDETACITSGPYRVRIGGYIAVAWLCIILFSGAAIGAYSAHQFSPIWVFGAFVGLGVIILMGAGKLTFDQDSIRHQCAFGNFRMHWCDVKKIERSAAGTLILIGDKCRFIIAPPNYWSGPERLEAFTLLDQKIQALGLVPIPSRTADYKWHKNVRVPR
jgi:hypothetical protein